MSSGIFSNVKEFLRVTGSTEVLWVVLPLMIATIALIFYFEKYKSERPGWNTLFANSLVLLFVSIIMFRYIYSLDGVGAYNFIEHLNKSIASLIILFIGVIMMFLNFEHALPEKIAAHLSSPLNLNIFAYVSIVYVFSEFEGGWHVFLSLLILFVALLIIFNLIKIPIRKFFDYLGKMKEKEKIENIKQEKKPIKEKKEKLKKEERLIRKEKKAVKKEEAKVESQKLKELDKQKKEAVKLKKEVT